MACSGLKRWIKIALTSSTCQNYVVCSNSWQFRRWTLSLTAHTACPCAFADCLTAHHQDSGITARSSFCSVGAAAAAGLAARLLQLVCTRVCGDLWGWVGRMSAGCRGEKNAASYAFLFSRRPRVQRTKSSCAARQCTCSGGCGAAARLSLGPAPRPGPHAMYLKSG